MLFAIVPVLWAACLLLTLQVAGGQQQIQLTKEFVDTLLQVLSPLCKNELESALGSALVDGISEVCKNEIQEVFLRHAPNDVYADGSAKLPQATAADDNDNDNDNPFAQKKTSKQDAPPPFINPVYSIAIFLAIFFSAIGGLVYYVHVTRSSLPAAKPKKLSKKKVQYVHQLRMLCYALYNSYLLVSLCCLTIVVL